MSFISDTDEKDHALAMKSLSQGIRLMKTELNALSAYQMMLTLANEKIGRRIYVYDISGEMFSSSSDVQSNLAYSYADGFIFIIDPLTLNQFAMEVEDKLDLNAYGASSKDFEDILNIMLINLEKMFGLKDKDTLKRSLAVVINKSDIPTLEERVGETAAQQYLAEHPDTAKAPGADLVEAVKPEEEGARLREQDPEFSRLLEEHSRGAETPADSGAEPPADGAATPSEGAESSAEGSAPEGGTPSGDGSAEGGLSSRGYAPSPAGRSHETDPSLFRSKTTTIRTKGKRKTIKLRMKLPAPPRLRDSKTGEYIDAKQSK